MDRLLGIAGVLVGLAALWLGFRADRRKTETIPARPQRVHLVFWPALLLLGVGGALLLNAMRDVVVNLTLTSTGSQFFLLDALYFVTQTLPLILAATVAALVSRVGWPTVRVALLFAAGAMFIEVLTLPAVQRISSEPFGILERGAYGLSLAMLAAGWLALRGRRGARLWLGLIAGGLSALLFAPALQAATDRIAAAGISPVGDEIAGNLALILLEVAFVAVAAGVAMLTGRPRAVADAASA